MAPEKTGASFPQLGRWVGPTSKSGHNSIIPLPAETIIDKVRNK